MHIQSIRRRMPSSIVGSMVLALAVLAIAPVWADDRTDALRGAARDGDLATVKRLHEAGVDINARTKYGATALSYACDKGHIDVVRYLVANGADLENTDEFYNVTPLGWSLFNEHREIVKLLVEAGAEGIDQVLTTGVRQNDLELVELALGTGKLTADDVAGALTVAAQVDDSEKIVELLKSSDIAPAETGSVEVATEVLQRYVGTYKNDEIGMVVDIRLEDEKLMAQAHGQGAFTLSPTSENEFEAVEVPQLEASFEGRGGIVERMIVVQQGQRMVFTPVAEEGADEAAADEGEAVAEGSAPKKEPVAVAEVTRGPARNWPAFRGADASGIADGQGAPTSWNIEDGTHIRFKTPIPGLGNSSPIVWGDRVFVTTAVSAAGDDTFRTGLYGDVDSVDDTSEHAFKVYALSTTTGEIVWEKTVVRRVPGAKRHLKSTQANSTPVTDGKRVVSLFGTVGLLVAHDLKGKELWRKDIGVLDAGWFYDESYQWGHASSPVIYEDLVIVQADIYRNSFIAAYRLRDGKEVWKTSRDEVPTWGTPAIYRGKKRDELITNGTTIRGYDPKTGKELWSLGPNSEVTVATPVIADDLVFVTAGYPPVRPVYAIRPGGAGDLTLPEDATSSDSIAWSKSRGGTYMPTPIAYRGRLYTCANNGRLTAYDASTGEEIFKARVSGGGSYTASPIAADGHLYFTDEAGDITVVRTGDEYDEVGVFEMGEVVMSTPAISDGLLVVRTLNHVVGIGEPPAVAGN